MRCFLLNSRDKSAVISNMFLKSFTTLFIYIPWSWIFLFWRKYQTAKNFLPSFVGVLVTDCFIFQLWHNFWHILRRGENFKELSNMPKTIWPKTEEVSFLFASIVWGESKDSFVLPSFFLRLFVKIKDILFLKFWIFYMFSIVVLSAWVCFHI